MSNITKTNTESIEIENGSFANGLSLLNLTENHNNQQHAVLRPLYPPSLKKHFKRKLPLVKAYDFLLSFVILFILSIPVLFFCTL